MPTTRLLFTSAEPVVTTWPDPEELAENGACVVTGMRYDENRLQLFIMHKPDGAGYTFYTDSNGAPVWTLSNTITGAPPSWASVTSKPTFSTVATSGSYNDLTDKPTIPTNNNQLTNGAGYITGINSSAVTTALGFTPYNATNPSGYVNQAGARSAISLTTTGTSGAATYNSSTGVLNIPNYAPGTGTVTSVGISSSDFTVSGSPVTTSGSITLNLTTTGITAGTYGLLTVDTKGRATAGKRAETYSVTTNASGVASVTFATPYSVAPNIQLQPTNFSSDNQFARVTAISTTGFSVIARLHTDLVGLLPTFSNINGATIDVLINEK